MSKHVSPDKDQKIAKALTGIQGLDEVLDGGLPRGRSILVCGNAGCGKSLLAMQFLINGVKMYGEKGLFVSFEETAEELKKNFSSLGADLYELENHKQMAIDYVFFERSEIKETGEFDLEGLFIRIGHAIDTIGAKRVVLDTIETLFSGFSNEGILRAELRRLFRWLNEKGVTTVITAEKTGELLTRHGLEEYVADCVILLENNIIDQIATRRLRVVKYRGSSHGANEYPFSISHKGITVFPITSFVMEYHVSEKRISSGNKHLDGMLGGKGYFKGSSILVSGSPGSGKTIIAAHFLDAACRRGEKCLWFSFEESADQIKRNMMSAGLNLKAWAQKGCLEVICQRPSFLGLEFHLLSIHEAVERYQPACVVIDPVSCFASVGQNWQIASMLSRLVTFLKSQHITALFTHLTGDNPYAESSCISTLCDTWIVASNAEGFERHRRLGIVKSRGMCHAEEFLPLKISGQGIELGSKEDFLRKGTIHAGTFGGGH